MTEFKKTVYAKPVVSWNGITCVLKGWETGEYYSQVHSVIPIDKF